MKRAVCIGCSCDDDAACDLGCAWVEVDRRAGLGVCSSCTQELPRFRDMRRSRYLVRITYKIKGAILTPWVWGYAIRLPAPFRELRFCVREVDGEWQIDHFDSGMSFGGPLIDVLDEDPKHIRYMKRGAQPHATRAGCVAWLGRYLKHLAATKKLRPLLARHGFSWCLDEAGL